MSRVVCAAEIMLSCLSHTAELLCTYTHTYRHTHIYMHTLTEYPKGESYSQEMQMGGLILLNGQLSLVNGMQCTCNILLHVYICIYVCVCVCVYEREREYLLQHTKPSYCKSRTGMSQGTQRTKELTQATLTPISKSDVTTTSCSKTMKETICDARNVKACILYERRHTVAKKHFQSHISQKRKGCLS